NPDQITRLISEYGSKEPVLVKGALGNEAHCETAWKQIERYDPSRLIALAAESASFPSKISCRLAERIAFLPVPNKDLESPVRELCVQSRQLGDVSRGALIWLDRAGALGEAEIETTLSALDGSPLLYAALRAAAVRGEALFEKAVDRVMKCREKLGEHAR